MLKYVRHVSLFLFMSVVRISCYEFLVQSSFFSRFHRNSIRQLQLSNLKVASSKTSIFPVEFHPPACRFEVDSPSFIFNGRGMNSFKN